MNPGDKSKEIIYLDPLFFNNQYQNCPRFVERENLFMCLVDKLIPKGAHILDFGCGSGYLSRKMAQKGYQVTGIDGSPDMIDYCNKESKQKVNQEIKFGLVRIPDDIQEFKVYKPFDAIIASSVFEYLDNLSVIMKWISGLLEEHGVIIVSMPNRSSFYRILQTISFLLIGKPNYLKYVKNMTTVASFKELVEKCGLIVSEYNYFGSSLTHSKFLNRSALKRFLNTMIVFTIKKRHGSNC